MDEIMIMRLRAITEQMRLFSKEAEHFISGSLDESGRVEVLISKLDTTIKRFTTELYEYFRICREPATDEISEFSDVQLQAEELLVELKTKLNRKPVESQDNNKMVISSRLPKLELPIFEGDILQWSTFFDQFNSNIDSKNLSDVDKFLYLKSSLKGEAKTAIEGLDITNKNYSIALSILKERYGREVQIIDAHYAALYKIKPADKTIQNCRKTLLDIERHLRVLNSLGEDTDQNHIRFLIMEKFPEDLIYDMKMKTKSDSTKEIRKQLEIVISAKEDANRISKGICENERESCSVETLLVRNEGQFKDRTDKNKIDKDTRNQFGEYRFNNSNLKRRLDNQMRSNSEPENKKRKMITCIFCRGYHFNDQCTKFETIKERKERLEEMQTCFKCFGKGHFVRNCNRKITCAHCKATTHNRALCFKKFKHTDTKQETATSLHLMSKGTTTKQHITILQTAIIMVKHLKCRVLMDSGSQRSYVTSSIAKELELPVEEENLLSVFTFGSKVAQEIESPLVKLCIRTKAKEELTLFANVVPIIAQSVPYPKEILNRWKDRSMLADDGSLEDRVDILIGNDYYFGLILTDKVEIQKDLFLVNSKLGWVLTGKTDKRPLESMFAITYFQSCAEIKLTEPDLPLDSNKGSIKSLWELESIGITDSLKACRDEEAIKNFNETTEIIERRYTVSWPWIEYPPNLPTNFGLALGRLVALLKRLDGDTLINYNKTIEDQIEQGIIELVPNPQDPVEHPVHYLPHHGVQAKDKPIRIVYDASAKTKGDKSLNECLYCGPMMLEELTSLLLRFRSHRIGLSADVEKAFLQIALHHQDRDVTRFLWLKDISKAASGDNLAHMRFKRVPFGIISSPFLLNATIRHHLMQSEKENMSSITNDIYVDNLITGTNTVQEALDLYKECKKEFNDISMNLRQWSCNSNDVMLEISDTCENDVVKLLGLDWQLDNDTLQLRYKGNAQDNTKRGILKTVAAIYDPCGFVAPSILPAKLLIQELWKRKVDWDAPLPNDINKKWQEIKINLQDISEMSIPRFYFRTDTNDKYVLHCFTDASKQAYAAVIYIVKGDDKSFVIGKSRLAPLKNQDSLSIPRLELLGCLIGSRLIKYVLQSLKLNINRVFLWTDSQIIIDWYYTDKLLNPFVARRISEIKAIKDLTIKYVPSELNPADVATRPISTRENKKYWLSGPDFLTQNTDNWPVIAASFLAGECPPIESSDAIYNRIQLEQTNLMGDDFAKDNTEPPDIIITDSDIQTNLEDANTSNEQKVNMEIDNIIQSETEKIKVLQLKYFPEESKGKQTSLARNLGLFLDIDGLLRCGGRLMHADLSFDQKHPILIPKDCDFTIKLIQNTHEKNYHVGVSHTLSMIRQAFWIPQGRAQVQKVLKRCARCIKHGGGPYQLPATPALPVERVKYDAPFVFTGIDYFGPILVKVNDGKEKRWICLLTCLVVRSIHLEVVKDMSAEECLLALRRFMAIRGIPSLILSDNASYFKLTADVMGNQYCISNKIKWKFIPELAPWHGGVYERLVGVVKHCLRRSLDKYLLNDTQLQTVIKEVETVVNLRPLTVVGTDQEHILKPLDFLSLGKCMALEETDSQKVIEGSTIKTNLVIGWKRGLNLLNEFKIMFTNQYLQNLRERYKNESKQPRVKSYKNPCVGDLVQIKGESKNRVGWKVGRITAVIKGTDGKSRVARVKVGNSEYTRSIGHLYPLEADIEKDDVYFPKWNDNIDQQSNNQNEYMVDLESNLESNVIKDLEPNDTTDLGDITEVKINKDPEPAEIGSPQRIHVSDDIDIDDTNLMRPKRQAAIKALEKMKEWTQNLIAQL